MIPPQSLKMYDKLMEYSSFASVSFDLHTELHHSQTAARQNYIILKLSTVRPFLLQSLTSIQNYIILKLDLDRTKKSQSLTSIQNYIILKRRC